MPLTALILWLMLVASGTSGDLPSRSPAVENPASDAEFIGPFANWADLKRDYGAIGDGKADDTAALQKALDDLKADKKSHCLYLPAGTYRIWATAQNSDPNTQLIGTSDYHYVQVDQLSYTQTGQLPHNINAGQLKLTGHRVRTTTTAHRRSRPAKPTTAGCCWGGWAGRG